LPQLWRILKALSGLQEAPDLKLDDVAEHASQVISPGHLMICVTPSLDTSWVKAWRSVGHVRERGMYVVLLSDESSPFQDVDQALSQLRRRGIQARVISTNQIHPIEASYGVLRRWEFKTLPTGKTIVLQRPRMAASVFPAGDT
jgi:hypothetical protein